MAATAYTKAGLIEEIKLRCQDTEGALSNPAYVADGIERFIDDGLTEYSRIRPFRTTAEVTATDDTGVLPVPSGWDNSLSEIEWIEYPQGSKQYLDNRLFTVDKAGDRIRLAFTLPTGTKVNVRFSRVHTLSGWRDATTTSIPGSDFTAVACKCAAGACRALAAIYAGRRTPGVAAERVGYPSDKATTFRDLARDNDAEFTRRVAPKDADEGAVSETVNLDVRMSVGGGPLFLEQQYR